MYCVLYIVHVVIFLCGSISNNAFINLQWSVIKFNTDMDQVKKNDDIGFCTNHFFLLNLKFNPKQMR